MSGLTVVPLREGPPLTDVAGRLEDLAGRIRRGEIPAAVAIVVLADVDDRIELRAFGAVRTAAHTVGLMKMATDDLTRTVTQSMPRS